MRFRPPRYSSDALAPYISSANLVAHRDIHERYYEKLVRRAHGRSVEELVNEAVSVLEERPISPRAREWAHPILDAARQVENHNLFWRSMAPVGSATQIPPQALVDQLVHKGVARFGSGWAWLVHDGDHLRWITTKNALQPVYSQLGMVFGCCDLWEHAYYLDYLGDRAEWLRVFATELFDWSLLSQVC